MTNEELERWRQIAEREAAAGSTKMLVTVASQLALIADAARYRWLCNGNGYFLEEQGIAGHGEEKDAADRAIDEAMRRAQSRSGDA